MHIRNVEARDLPVLVDLTIEAFRPLFERHLPALVSPEVFAHDHASWENDYRSEVPALHAPEHHRFITVAEEGGRLLGYVGWNVTDGDAGRLEMVATRPADQRRGVGTALCRDVLGSMRGEGVAVVHVGTGGDAFHAPARRLYESLGFTGWPVVDYARPL
jgi:ribosomal protein S18 acetylase RimI-like enzyme